MRIYDPATTLMRLLVVVSVATVGYFSLTTVPVYDSASIVQRVVVHVFAFFVLSVLAGFAFRERYREHWIRSVGVLAGIAVVMELLQFGTAAHVPSLLDIGLNIVGAVAGVPVVLSFASGEEEARLPEEVDEGDPRTRVDMNQELRQQAAEQGDITQITPDET